MKNRVIHTPIDLSVGKRVGKNLLEKQILPLGSITYEGRKITFDRKYLMDLANSFRDQAFDQVPVQFADGLTNAHNLDPKNFGGEVVDLVVKKDGLYGLVRPTGKSSQVLADNPKLGVSARIMEGVSKADGRHFNRAIQHVLLTLDPKVTGMKPWQAVDLSNIDQSERPVIDLSSFTYERDSNMAKRTTTLGRAPKRTAKAGVGKGHSDIQEIDLSNIDLSKLDDETFARLLELSNEADDDEDDDIEDDDEDLDDDDSEDEDDEDDEDEDEEDDDVSLSNKSKKKATVDLSNKGKGKPKARTRHMDLSNAALAGQRGDDIKQMQIELAQSRWEREKDVLLSAGVPPFLIDLAEPVLASPDNTTIDLSNTAKPVDAKTIMRSMLEGVKGMVDLSAELGHAMDLSTVIEDKASKALDDAWDQEYGSV